MSLLYMYHKQWCVYCVKVYFLYLRIPIFLSFFLFVCLFCLFFKDIEMTKLAQSLFTYSFI